MVKGKKQQFKNQLWKKYNYTDQNKTFNGDPNDCEVYLGNLPSNFTPLECFQLFGKFGRIASMRMSIGTHRYNHNKGYGFITFHKATAAEKAYTKLNGFEIQKGLNINVSLCRLQRHIYIGKIPPETSEKEIINQFSTAFDGILNLTVMKPYDDESNTRQKNLGLALLEFNNHCNAQNTVRLLNSGIARFWNKTLISGWTEHDKLHKHVILSGISDAIPERFLIDRLQHASNNGLVHCNWSYGRLNLEFNTNYQAELAIKALGGIEVGGSVLQFDWNLFPIGSFDIDIF